MYKRQVSGVSQCDVVADVLAQKLSAKYRWWACELAQKECRILNGKVALSRQNERYEIHCEKELRRL